MLRHFVLTLGVLELSIRTEHRPALITAFAFSIMLSAACEVDAKTDPDLKELAKSAQGRVGVSAEVVETGAHVEYNAQQRYPMQSVFKLPTAIVVLNHVEQNKLKLDQVVHVEDRDLAPGIMSAATRYPADKRDLTLQELLRRMMEDSDNTACDVMLRLLGGTGTVQKFLRDHHFFGIVEVATEKEMGASSRVQYRNWAKPRSMTALLCALQKKQLLSNSSRKLLFSWMRATTVCPNRIKAGLPKDVILLHKSGTSAPTNGFTPATNDVGLVDLPGGKHIAISIFVADSHAPERQREGTIAKITTALYNFLKLQ